MAFTKQRWIGERLIDVFASEFKAYSRSYYEKALREGNITINGKVGVAEDYRMRDGDRIVHKTLRRETPVFSELPKVLHDDARFLVVSKPASIPVHPCGNFKENSLLNILERCLGHANLRSVHRLDRQTSGIVFFAKDETCSNEFREALISNQVQKTYVARVQGDFRKACLGSEKK